MDENTYIGLAIARAQRSGERIRTISDYDDFYIADKGECRQVVNNARDFYQKFLLYIEKYDEFSGHLEELKSYIDKGNTK